MLTRMNAKMKAILSSKELADYLADAHLVPPLEQLVQSSILEMEGCFLLEGVLPTGFDVTRALAESTDRTEVEASANHHHIPFGLPGGSDWDRRKIFAQGYLFALRLADRLKEKGHFQVVFSFQDDEYIESTVRFYLVRPGEAWLSADIEGYKINAVLAIDTIVE